MNTKFFMALIGLCLLTACQKDLDEVVWDNLPQTTDDVYLTETGAYLNKIFNDLSPDLPSYTYNSDSSAVIQLSGGLNVLSLPSNGFLRSNGENAEGEIDIRVLVVEEKSDMIRYRATTKSGSQLLSSEVEVFLAAFQNGEGLTFNPELNYSIALESQNFNESNQVYIGEVDNNETLNWSLSDFALTSLEFGSWDATNEDGGFISVEGQHLSSNTFGWIALSQMVEESEETNTLELVLPAEFGNLNTTAFLVLDEYDTVVNLMVGATDEHFEYTGLPLGASGKVFVMGVLDGEGEEEIYAEVFPVILNESSVETLEALNSRSLLEVQELLNDI